MRINVRLFAILKDLAGTAQAAIELPEGSTAAAAVEAVAARHPATREALRRSAVAVNQAYAPVSTVLRDGDEVAIIPPVSGG